MTWHLLPRKLTVNYLNRHTTSLPWFARTLQMLLMSAVRSHSNVEVIKLITWDDVRVATASDPSMIQLIELIHQGFPELSRYLSDEIRPCSTSSENISHNSMVCASTRTGSSSLHHFAAKSSRHCTLPTRVWPACARGQNHPSSGRECPPPTPLLKCALDVHHVIGCLH